MHYRQAVNNINIQGLAISSTCHKMSINSKSPPIFDKYNECSPPANVSKDTPFVCSRAGSSKSNNNESIATDIKKTPSYKSIWPILQRQLAAHRVSRRHKRNNDPSESSSIQTDRTTPEKGSMKTKKYPSYWHAMQ